MSRTNIDIPDDLVERAMRMYALETKRDAVILALKQLVGGDPMTKEEMLAMGGNGLRHRPRGAAPGLGAPRAVILVDTSAWIAYLRRDGSHADLAVAASSWRDGELATTDIVQLEMLAGARDPRHLGQLRQLLAGTIHARRSAPASTPSRLPRSTGRAGARVRRPASSTTASIARWPSATTCPCCTPTATSRSMARHTPCRP